MAIGVDIIQTSGRMVFDLERDGEKTSRTIEIPYPIDDTAENLQTLVNQMNATYTNSEGSNNVFIQPANWRDTNVTEDQWTTTGFRYEIVTTTTRPITPDE